MSQVQYSEQNPMETLEAAEEHARRLQKPEKLMETLEAAEKHGLRLQKPDKLMEACATAQEAVPEGTVVADCGRVSLTLQPTRFGFGKVFIAINSFKGPITAVSFFGEWVRLGFPPAAGVFNNTNTKVFNLNTPNVALVATIAPGRFLIFANLTFLLATTAEGPCIGLLPSDLKQFP
jgi:hypothetical protein